MTCTVGGEALHMHWDEEAIDLHWGEESSEERSDLLTIVDHMPPIDQMPRIYLVPGIYLEAQREDLKPSSRAYNIRSDAV